jgi:hypothetical protein
MTLIELFTSDAAETKEAPSSERVTQAVEELSKSIEEKAGSPGFLTTIRIVSSAETEARAQLNLEG